MRERHHNPGFMDKTNPGGMSDAEVAARRQRRLEAGCCPQCGRPASVARFDREGADLQCGCGWQGTFPPMSAAYKAARVFVGSRR